MSTAALLALADHLEPGLAADLRRLVDADAVAHQVIDLQDRTLRAEDLATECRRQLHALSRQVDAHGRHARALRAAEHDAVMLGTGFLRVTRDGSGGFTSQRLLPDQVALHGGNA